MLLHSLAPHLKGWFGGEAGLSTMRMPAWGLSFGDSNQVYYLTLAWVLLSLAAFWVVYLTLIGLDVFLLTRTARAGMHEPDVETPSVPAPDYVPEGARA